MALRVDAMASWRHFADHLLPIWRALPDHARGGFYATREVIRWHPDAPLTEGLPERAGYAPVLVAGFEDHHTVRPRPTILVNHGAGQTYVRTQGAESFSGGPNRDRVLLHLEPGPMAARASAAAGLCHVQVGCPYLDPWHRNPPEPTPGLVAVALHHNGRGAPEQMSAWPHYAAAVAELARHVDLVGHGHPRGWERTQARWQRIGVRPWARFADVLDRAALLVTDISSAGPMFASTGRPVVWISAPWHLAAPESGGRFHEWTRAVEGLGHVTDPTGLCRVVQEVLDAPQALTAASQAIVGDVYCATDGLAAERAAHEILRLLDAD